VTPRPTALADALTHDYLADLDAALAAGVARLPKSFLVRQAECLRTAQRPDGGFGGRRGGSDLYYTSFALRAAVLLDALAPDGWDRAAAYIQQCEPQAGGVVDAFCVLGSRRALAQAGHRTHGCTEGVQRALARCRRPDGSYTRLPGGEGSVYHTFLGTLCEQMLGLMPGDASAFVRSRRRPDGGFSDQAAAPSSGTNPAAAAVAVLSIAGSLDAETASGAAAFLAARQQPDGGFAAHAETPADLMSSFTALVALGHLGAVARIRRGALGRFVQRLVAPAGGFRAAAEDPGVDVEYTYYGLGALALLSLQIQRGSP
jgi:geranylgeranyl transferase type-2 subunit beta